MPTKQTAIVFDDFSGGDIGRGWPHQEDSVSNKIQAVNLVPYKHGIGPRNAFVLTAPTATPYPSQAVIMAAEPAYIFGATYPVMLLSNGKAYNIDTGTASVGTAPQAGSSYGDYTPLSGAIYAVHGTAGATISFFGTAGGGAQIIPVPGAPAGTMIEWYSPHVVIGSQVVGANLIKWSSPNDVFTWPAAHFAIAPFGLVDMANQKDTFVMFALGEALTIADVWTVSGVLSVNATMRRIDQGLAPNIVKPGIVDPIYSAGRDLLYWFNSNYMGTFNGAEVNVQDGPRPRLLSVTTTKFPRDPAVKIWNSVPSLQPNTFWLLGSWPVPGGSARIRQGVIMFHDRNGNWWPQDPRITYTVNDGMFGVGDYGRSTVHAAANLYGYVAGNDTGAGGASLGIITGGSDSAPTQAPKHYKMPLTTPTSGGGTPTEAPVSVGQNDGDSGAPVVAEMRTVDWFAPEGKEVIVRAVTLDLIASSSSANATMSVTAEALSLYDADKVSSSTAVAVSGPNISSWTTDTGPYEAGEAVTYGNYYRFRRHVNLGDQGAGNGFRIYLSNWVGWLLMKMTVHIEIMDARR